METRKVYMIINKNGQYLKGRAKVKLRWGSFAEGRLYERKNNATLTISHMYTSFRGEHLPMVVEFKMEEAL